MRTNHVHPDPAASGGERPHAALGALLQARRKELGWSLQKLAELVGCAKGYLSEIENDKRSPPADDVLVRIESAMMMPPGVLVEAAGWRRGLTAGGATVERELARLQQKERAGARLAELLRGRAESGRFRLDEAHSSGELKALVDRLLPPEARGDDGGSTRPPAMPRATVPVEVPVINKVAAGYPREFTDLSYPARVADQYVRCPDVSDPDAFAARVVGDSMEPLYREGEIIVFSPAREVQSGNDCFVRFERDGETTFKRVYFETGAGGEELIRLQPINSAYAPRVLPREDVAGIYVAVRLIRTLA